jgi:hypothetical protein
MKTKKIKKRKKPTKPRRDEHQMAFNVINAMGKEKNPAAQALGRMGGLARKTRLTSQQLSEIGKKSARVRWPNSGNKIIVAPKAA